MKIEALEAVASNTREAKPAEPPSHPSKSPRDHK